MKLNKKIKVLVTEVRKCEWIGEAHPEVLISCFTEHKAKRYSTVDRERMKGAILLYKVTNLTITRTNSVKFSC